MLDYATVNDLKTFLIFVEQLTRNISKLTSKDVNQIDGHQEYLRSLLAIVQRSHKEKPSWRLFAWMLKAAFKHEPLPFDDTWSSHTRPPLLKGIKPIMRNYRSYLSIKLLIYMPFSINHL
jgi:hypothetical protein